MNRTMLNDVGKTIGKGTFGKVKLGNHNLTSEKVLLGTL